MGVSAERFNRQNFDYNTKLIETLFNDLKREIPNTDNIKSYLEAFVRELRNVGGHIYTIWIVSGLIINFFPARFLKNQPTK